MRAYLNGGPRKEQFNSVKDVRFWDLQHHQLKGESDRPAPADHGP